MKRVNQTILSLLAAAVLWAAPARALDSTFVAVTPHSEEALTWCGAATGQMIIGAYPAGACPMVQADVWDSIQLHKVESSWDTDPVGLRDAMMTLCPPPGGHWVVVAQPAAANVMYSVAFWMKTNHYPVAALLSNVPHNSVLTHREHWVVIRGIITDQDPLTHPSVVLQNVLIMDEPVSLGDPIVERFLTGTQWYSEFQAVTIGGSAYSGKFVAVIEPPQKTGTATAKTRLLAGAVISAERAAQAAQRWIQSSEVTKVESFRELAGLRAQKPILVSPERAGYYIVPYASPGKPASMAVLVNAYSADVLEAGRFSPRPIPEEKEAVSNALRFLGREKPKQTRATLVAAPDGGSPYFPAWRVTVDEEEVLVNTDGNVRRPVRRPNG